MLAEMGQQIIDVCHPINPIRKEVPRVQIKIHVVVNVLLEGEERAQRIDPPKNGRLPETRANNSFDPSLRFITDMDAISA